MHFTNVLQESLTNSINFGTKQFNFINEGAVGTVRINGFDLEITYDEETKIWDLTIPKGTIFPLVNGNKALIYHEVFEVSTSDYVNYYIKDYVNYLADLLKVDSLKFNVMHSPREYNFTSDDLVCTISRDDAWKLYQNLDKDKYAENVARATTAVPGFFPFYKKEDFYFDSKEDLPVNNAALLSVLMDTATYQALTEEYGGLGDNYDYELYLRFDEDHHINDYYWFDEILADESDNIEAKADVKKSQI
jgi:hypothetical protein